MLSQIVGIFLDNSIASSAELSELISGKTITYSFDAKADSNIDLSYGKRGNTKSSSLTNEWQRFYITFNNAENCTIFFYNKSATVATFYIRNIKLIFGEGDTSYSPYGQGSVEVKKLTENVIDLSKSVALYNTEITEIDKENGIIKVHRTNTQAPSIEINCNLPAGQYSLLHNSHNFGQISLKYGTNKERVEDIGSEKYKTFYAEKGITKLIIYSGSELPTDYEINFSDIILVMGNVAREDIKYVKYQESSYILDIQKPMLSGDYFVKEADGWKEVHTFGYVNTREVENLGVSLNTSNGEFRRYNAYNLVTDRKSGEYLKILCTHFKRIDSRWHENEGICGWETGQSFCIGTFNTNYDTADRMKTFLQNNDVGIYYELATPTKLPCTESQITVLNQLQNIILYDDTTNIILPDVYPILDYDVSKIIDTTTTFEASLDSNGYFVVPDYDIKCLISYSESDIPSMPEAVETAVSVPGRDGDIPLNTTYNPIPFNIVCYTEDNLTPEEKYAEETKMNKFLNSIKNNTIKLKLESKGKYYDVKYNGQLTTTNYPKHLQFSIPLKSSSSYAKDIDESYILGNGEKESNTIKEVGAVFVIEGPAQTPKIYLNDYEMFYDNVLLSNTKLVIDSNKSTVTMINREGTETNAMRYYNHEFPKIQNGNNILKVSSGIDEDRQVSVRWSDLKL